MWRLDRARLFTGQSGQSIGVGPGKGKSSGSSVRPAWVPTKFVAVFCYPARVASVELAMDLEEVVKNLVQLGLDEAYVRNQFAGLPDPAAWLDEVAALITESEAALVLGTEAALPVVLFELIDALRQVGAKASCGQTADGALAINLQNGAKAQTYKVQIDSQADVLSLVRAIVGVLPRAQQVLVPVSTGPDDFAAASGVLTLIVLERGTFVALRAAVGDGDLEKKFARVSGEPKGVKLIPIDQFLAPIDATKRVSTRLAELEGRERPGEGVFERLSTYDPRVAWPSDRKRPPGDDFFQFCAGLANGSLARAINARDDAALANLLYRFALATLVGAHYDVAAARLNPGMSAQGVLGFGQLTWAWFIFEALGATEEAANSGKLLDSDWVRTQERSNVALRQRAYYDLGSFLRTGARGPALGRLFPFVALADRDAWLNRIVFEAALATHSETTADQLTHHPLYYLWPAPLYALARRAGALDILPRDNPFLSRQLDISAVDSQHDIVAKLKQQLGRFAQLDEAKFAPLLDPLPVIIDIWITEVDEHNAHGRTMLAERDEVEHRVTAPHSGRSMRPGEVWLFEVQGARAATKQASFEDLGDVSFHVAVPTGQWLQRA